jgi:hypothetical protein
MFFYKSELCKMLITHRSVFTKCADIRCLRSGRYLPSKYEREEHERESYADCTSSHQEKALIEHDSRQLWLSPRRVIVCCRAVDIRISDRARHAAKHKVDHMHLTSERIESHGAIW